MVKRFVQLTQVHPSQWIIDYVKRYVIWLITTIKETIFSLERDNMFIYVY